MNDELAIRKQFESELAAIASFDRVYYAKHDPSAAERAEYAARRDEHERLRAQFHAELMALHCDRCAEQIGLGFCFDGSPHQCPCVGPPCRMPHDLREYMVIALWRCESLVDQLLDPVAKKEASALMEVMRKMTFRLREHCPFERPHVEKNSSA